MTTNPRLWWDAKDPTDVAPYSLNFKDWLIPKTSTTDRDEIDTASVTTSDAALTATGSLITGDVVTTVLSGGTAGQTYQVHFLVNTVAGYTVKRSVEIQVANR